MTDPKNMTTIPISKETRAKLQLVMKYGETYDGIIRQLIDNQTCPLCGKPSGGVHKDCADHETMILERRQ